ncbi:MAG TPA: hypothetical protein VJT32_04125 [bacterium]|nr:hypothetical protein [bacterium]
MGDRPLSGFLVTYIAGHTLAQVANDMLQNAQLLGGLAQLLQDEEMTTIANAPQLLESALKCVDCVELIVRAAMPPDEDAETNEERLEASNMAEDMTRIRRQLDKMRASLLDNLE